MKIINHVTSKRNILFIFLLAILLVNSTSSSVAQATNISFPEYNLEEYTLPVNSEKDIYIQTEPYHQLLNSNFAFNASSMNWINYNGMSRTDFAGTQDQNENFDISNSGIDAFMNATPANQELKYTRNYFGLFTSNATEVKNAFLENGNNYLATFNIGENEPVYFSFLMSQITGATSLTLTVKILDPEGNLDTRVVTVTRGVEQVIPFVSDTAGTYYISIVTNRDTIMESLKFVVSPLITTIDSGYLDHLQADHSIVRFLKVENPNAVVVDLAWLGYQQEYIASASDPTQTVTFGDYYLRTFSPSNYMFGSSLPSNPSPGAVSYDFYIAIVATVADNNDPEIRFARDFEGYDHGMDIEITVSVRKYDLTQLPINEDFDTTAVDPYSSSGSRFYSFQTTEPIVVGVNSTSTTSLVFYSADPTMPFISVDPTTNDLLNSATDDAVILAPGTYAVEAPTGETYHVVSFSPKTLNIGTSTTVTLTYDERELFYLPGTEFADNLINVTYPDKLNESVTVNFRWYDINGNYISGSGSTPTLTHYYDSNPNLVVNNQTTINPNENYNLEGYYLKLNITHNGWYNETDTPVYSDATNITSRIRLERINLFRNLQDDHSSDAYYYEMFTNSLSYDTNQNNNTIQVIMDFNSKENTVYKLTIDSTNRTIDASGNGDTYDTGFYMFVSDSNSWYSSVTQLTEIVKHEGPRNISHYILDIYFATTEAIHIGMILNLEATISGENGTLDINLQELPITKLPSLDIADISSSKFTEIGEGGGSDKGGFFSNPLLIGAAAGGIAIIAALVVFLMRRGRGGKTPF